MIDEDAAAVQKIVASAYLDLYLLHRAIIAALGEAGVLLPERFETQVRENFGRLRKEAGAEGLERFRQILDRLREQEEKRER